MANEQVYYSALHWAKKAEASAKQAAELAQKEGEVIQLGFDGTIEDGKLVFKHAPGGVAVPYQLVANVEYEIDLAYGSTGDLPNLTEIVVQNGNDTIRFVSALHREATTNATVADMDAVMRYNSSTGYRWLFKATFKVAPNGAKVFLLYPVVAAKDYSDKTNCITEIPQDIKLELVDGVLTLKAGSKVYVPNGKNADGSNRFDEVVISTDTSRNTALFDGKMMLFYYLDGALSGRNLSTTVETGSGTTLPSNDNYTFYNTSDNKIYVKRNNQIESYISSFPIGVATVSGGVITSIDQVFNGFGYIGSTVFALPGVKGLIPNGRNEDGSLRNIEFVTDKVLCSTLGNITRAQEGFIIIKSDGAFSYTTTAFYDEELNFFRGTQNGVLYTLAAVGKAKITEGVISNFSIKQPFHAVDYQDAALKQNFQVVSTLPSSPQPDVFYFIPE